MTDSASSSATITLMERLRRLQALRAPRTDLVPPPAEAIPVPPSGPGGEGRLAALVPGRQVENAQGVCFVSEHAFPVQMERGGHPLADLLARRAYPLTAPQDFDFTQALFLDTETTGLGGAGVYAFMVGVGTFEAESGIGDWGLGTLDAQSPIPNPQSPLRFVVRQFFMRNPAEEPALLTALAELLQDREAVVTFNGRTFDLPLLRGRFSQNRRLLPPHIQQLPLLAGDAAHLDLLSPARRLWRRRLQSVRLIHLEQAILGLVRAEADVPGSLIPYLYTQFLRTGHAGEMSRVFYHNREDIVSMVSLAERLCRHFVDPFAPDQQAEIHGLDMLSLGHIFEAAGDLAQAEAAFRHALADLTAAGELAGLAQAFAWLGGLLKRQGRWEEAAEIWQRWLTTVPGPDPTPYVELAKFCEWQTGDLEQAAMWTGWALHNLAGAPAHRRPAGAIQELQHRLARIQGKSGTAPGG